MAKKGRSTGSQTEMFDLFEVRQPVDDLRPLDLSNRIKRGLSQAMKDCPMPADVIALRMSAILGIQVNEHQLYSYTAVSKPDHQIPLLRFIAFVRATEAVWLWQLLVEDEGLTVLQGREAKLAQVGALEQQKASVDERLKSLKAELKHDPVTVTRKGGGQ